MQIESASLLHSVFSQAEGRTWYPLVLCDDYIAYMKGTFSVNK